MATLISYTSYDEVRAVLGLNKKELKDDTLALSMYETIVAVELDDVAPNLNSEYLAIINTTTSTDEQKDFAKLVKVFATFAIAKYLLTSLPMLAPKDISDGKATLSRFSDSPYKETQERVTASYSLYRNKVSEAYNTLFNVSNVSVSFPLMGSASPTFNPVTNE